MIASTSGAAFCPAAHAPASPTSGRYEARRGHHRDEIVRLRDWAETTNGWLELADGLRPVGATRKRHRGTAKRGGRSKLTSQSGSRCWPTMLECEPTRSWAIDRGPRQSWRVDSTSCRSGLGNSAKRCCQRASNHGQAAPKGGIRTRSDRGAVAVLASANCTAACGHESEAPRLAR